MSKRICCAIKEFPNDRQSQYSNPLDYLNSPDVIKLKKDLLNGVKNPACETCWKKESKNIKSLRNSLNDVLTEGKFEKPNWIDSYFNKAKNKEQSTMILSADVKIGNTCNHACVMCVPEDSSLIYRDWVTKKDSQVVKKYLEKDPTYLERVMTYGYKNDTYLGYLAEILEDNDNLKSIKLLGGETLLERKLLTMLRNIEPKRKENLKIHFVTNGSVDLQMVSNYIGRFKHLSCSVSLEGIEEIQEWARFGSRWQSLEKNILKTVEKDNIDIYIQHTFQTATVMGFDKLAKWCSKNNLLLRCGVVENPKCLGIGSLPLEIKHNLFENLNDNRSIVDHQHSDEGIMDFNNLIEIIRDTSFERTLYQEFLEYVSWYENGKNIKPLRSIFPELYSADIYSSRIKANFQS